MCVFFSIFSSEYYMYVVDTALGGSMGYHNIRYSKTCVKWPVSKRQKWFSRLSIA